MGSHQSTFVGPYLVASDPVYEEVTKDFNKLCTVCKKFTSLEAKFCNDCGPTLETKTKTRKYVIKSDALENDERLFTMSSWLPDRKDGSVIYAANIGYEGRFEDNALDYDNGGVLPITNLEPQKYIEAFKSGFAETITEIAKSYRVLKFEFGVIQYWS